ncbi:DNA damage tolerance protein rad31 [Paracoccidioides lutzii Pb01]|uniref:Ubiquitin-like 1-activating enzyme E1A n=1 Tax=Paracoccidioides lutzii (strain ATCC MYA-826 / Pb01) TaxID=502779 RepID=C1GPP3_PARBA|nr:DNA damage tolerance protein rad31 [Paracoccidioides lutzii Pb01]EEH36164.2 DNA damage tolerance protein rad31 [Paracoccidioides lutzii Pb01]
MTSDNTGSQITADEIALYDRQIRLWGVKAQEKLRTAKILLITLRSLGAEVAKNLVLAGIGSLTIIDNATVREEDVGAQFFLSEDHINQNRAEAAAPQIRQMNPRVQVAVEAVNIRSKQPAFFASYDVTIATDLDYDTLCWINNSCRVANRRFYAAGIHGFYGYIFSDQLSHDFVIEREKSNVASSTIETPTRTILDVKTKRENDKVIEMITKREVYCPLILSNTSSLPQEFTKVRRKRLQVTPLLTCLRALWEFQREMNGSLPTRDDLETFIRLANDRHLELRLDISTLTAEFIRSFLDNLGSELSPVAAFLGGAVAQDVINVLGAREQPLQNLLLFDGERSVAPIYSLHPIFPEE